MERIRTLVIDLETRELRAYDHDNGQVPFPLNADGGTVIRWTNVSPGGRMIRALERLLADDAGDGRMR